MNERRITIDPITRLEGHGRIEIFLTEEGEVRDAVLQVPELRGFERFCRDRKAEDMPRITERICGVCPEAHHFASTKALDDAFDVTPPAKAIELRELLYNAYIFADHLLHIFYLGGPDFLAPSSTKAERNVLGVLDNVGGDVAKQVLKHRRLAHRIIEIIGGHQIHPVCGVPGGMSKGLTGEEKEEIQQYANSCVEFSHEAGELLRREIFETPEFESLVENDTYSLPTYYMGLVDEDSLVSFYRGHVKVITPQGEELYNVPPSSVVELIEEHVEPWTFVKFPYLKEVGWNGFCSGQESGVFRVGPLARLNVGQGMKTPQAQRELDLFREYFGPPPVHKTYAYHWARMVEMIQGAERMKELAGSEDITGRDGLRSDTKRPGAGVGVIEAARGTLIHNYTLDEAGLIERANMIVPSTSNNAAFSLSIQQAAKQLLTSEEDSPDERLLNEIEMSFRPYDPCLACASHTVDGGLDIEVVIYDHSGNEIRKAVRGED